MIQQTHNRESHVRRVNDGNDLAQFLPRRIGEKIYFQMQCA